MKPTLFLLLPAFLFQLGPFTSAHATLPAPSHTDGTVRVGQIAPDFSLKTLSGETADLSDGLAQDKPVLLVFWSYFCFPCQREIPQIEEIYQEIGSDRLAIIGLNLDGHKYSGKVVPFVEENGITFPNVYDKETDEFFEVAQRYGVIGTPTSFLLDPQGRVRFIHLGRLDPQVLKGVIESARDQSFCAEITKPAGPSDQ